MSVLLTGLLTFWAQRLNKENAELKRRLAEHERQMQKLQAYARMTVEEASAVVPDKSETRESVTPPRLLH